jgi:hypothetical protein
MLFIMITKKSSKMPLTSVFSRPAGFFPMIPAPETLLI